MAKSYHTIYAVPSVKNQGFEMTVQPLQDGVVFKKDLPIEFEVNLTKDNKPFSEGEIVAYFKWNSNNMIWHQVLKLVDGKAKINFISEQCGFGNLHVLFYLDDKEVFEQLRGIAISPEMIQRSYPRPLDFDDFWDSKKKSLAIPFDVTYTTIDKSTHPHLHQSTHKSLLETDISMVDIQDVQINCFEKGVSGILTRPKNRTPKSLPAILFVHGAGVKNCEPDRFVDEAAKGLVVFDINAHGIPNDMPKEWYKELGEHGALSEYQAIGRNDKNEFYFLNMFLRVKRALDFLKTLPEWDQKTLITFGGSQGCAQACAGAYLDEDVSAFVGQIPAYGDLTGFLRGRTVNFSDWLKMGERGRFDKKILDVAPYFDSANFTSNLKKEGLFCFGLLDQGCTPLVNYMPAKEHLGDTTVVFQSDCYHSVCPAGQDKSWDFIYEHIKKNNHKH